MFRDTRRKTLRNRVIFAAIGVLVMTFGIWLNYQDGEEDSAAEQAAKEVAVEEERKNSATQQKEEEREKALDKEEKGTDTGAASEAYLIKEVEGVVKVFLCRENGNKELYQITSIPFDLLSESDQQLFIDGVEIETEEELGKFLENFDS